MILRLLLVILVFGGSFWYIQNYTDTNIQKRIHSFISNTKDDIQIKTEETKDTLLEKKSSLEATLAELQQQVNDKVQDGQDKIDEVQANILATKEALNQVDESISNLNESLGLGESSE